MENETKKMLQTETAGTILFNLSDGGKITIGKCRGGKKKEWRLYMENPDAKAPTKIIMETCDFIGFMHTLKTIGAQIIAANEIEGGAPDVQRMAIKLAQFWSVPDFRAALKNAKNILREAGATSAQSKKIIKD